MNTEILEKRALQLRGYQFEPADYVMQHDIVVLAMAPNGGKTEVSIYAISEYLKNNPGAKVLVLTHSTNVLLDNFVDRLNNLDVDFSYSTDFEPEAQVHICLPHSEHKIEGEYDMLVVDEAHENYLAERVQRIIAAINPSKQLLLTGTPENFIKEGGYNIYFLALNDIPAEYFAKLSIELVASKYDWEDSYNREEHVDNEFVFNKQDTNNTLKAVVLKLIERLKKGYTAEQFNNPNLITKLKSWAFVYEEIGKTLIYARRIEQANQIYEILVENGVNAAISHSEVDNESDEISKFKRGEHDVLVVVDRAKLGYSDDELFNIIDMSGTHNPSLIYQMLCRCVRGTSEQQKYYLKVTPQGKGRMDLTQAATCAALMLTDKSFLSTYNGSNFNGILIPVISSPRDQDENETESGGEGNSNNRRNNDRVTFPEFTNDVIDMFRDIIHNLDNPISIYKRTTIGEIKYQLGVLKNSPSGYWTKDRCQKEALKYNMRSKFEKESNLAYRAAYKNNWLNDICGHMNTKETHKKGYWTKENCRKEALKHKTREEFRREISSAYSIAYKNGWLDEICSHMTIRDVMPANHWTKEKCHKEAKKHKSIGAFRRQSGSAYSAACKKGWVDEICSHMTYKRKPKGHWTKEKCQKEAKKYKTRTDFQKKSKAQYQAASKKGWLDEICSHMISKQKSKGYWTKEKCHIEAKKHKTRGEFAKKSKSGYGTAQRNGWLNEICSHMKSQFVWTKKACHEEALKHNVKEHFRNNSSGAYGAAYKNGWLDEICSHMESNKMPQNYWNIKENCEKEAKKHETRNEFRKKSSGAYHSSRKNNWLDEFFPKNNGR